MIRRYKPEDVDAVVSVWKAAVAVAHRFLSDEFLATEQNNVRNVYPKFAEIWVSEVDGRIVGFIAKIDNAEGKPEVGAIFLHPDHHGAGIGRAMMDFIVGREGALCLEVFRKNTIGRKFYDSYGFTEQEEYLHEASGQMMVKMRFAPMGAA